MWERLVNDSLSALRAFRRAPAAVVTAVLTLAVAVGLNLAMFGLVDRALLSPPPHLAAPDRVFAIAFERELNDGTRARMTTTSYVMFDGVRAQLPPGSAAAAWQRTTSTAAVDGRLLDTDAMLVSGSYFALVGARPVLGRALEPADDAAGAVPVAVISHAFWQSAFAGDRSILGRRFRIQTTDYDIVGVMPPGFSGHAALSVDAWVAFHAAMQANPGWDRQDFRNFLSILVRLPAGASPTAAGSALDSALGTADRRFLLTSIVGAGVSATEQRIAYWLTGVSVLLLVVGLANAATLLIVRGAERRRDLAIRTALGATRGRLAAQLMVEAGLLAATATAIAVLLAHWLDDGVRSVLLPAVAESSGLNVRGLQAAAVAGVVTLVVAGLAAIAQMPESLRSADVRAAAHTIARRRVHTGLLLVQTTLSVVLMAGAGLFGRSLYNLVSQDFGMRMDGVLLVEFDRGPGVPSMEDDEWIAAVERVRRVPGVRLATVVQKIPFTGFHVIPVAVPGQTEPPRVNGQLPYLLAATPELFDILEVRMIEGRRFTAHDDRGAPVVIVNETMARTVWPGESAIGKCFRIGFDPSFDPFTAAGPPPPPTAGPCREVVGVARNLRQRSVVPRGSEAHLMQYFVPLSQVPAGFGPGPGISGLLVRSDLEAAAIAPGVRDAVLQERTDLPFLRVAPYAALLEPQVRPWRLGTALLVMFGALAAGVAAVGLYAAFSHAVAMRRHELAVRLAVGAERRGVLLMILREALAVAVLGVIAGAAVTLIGGQAIQSMLVGTVPADPLVLGGAALTMLG